MAKWSYSWKCEVNLPIKTNYLNFPYWENIEEKLYAHLNRGRKNFVEIQHLFRILQVSQKTRVRGEVSQPNKCHLQKQKTFMHNT